MKHCPNCGAEHPDDVTECPIGQNPPGSEQTVIFSKKGIRRSRYDIPPLPVGKKQSDWVTILTPNDELETNIVMGRLKASGIEARLEVSRVGGWAGANEMKCVQVRPKDYDGARELLNAD
jgi:hypothetical protein